VKVKHYEISDFLPPDRINHPRVGSDIALALSPRPNAPARFATSQAPNLIPEVIKAAKEYCTRKQGLRYAAKKGRALRVGLRSNKPQKSKNKEHDPHDQAENRTDLGDEKEIEQCFFGIPLPLKSTVSSVHL